MSGDTTQLVLGIAALIALSVGGVGGFLTVFVGLLQFALLSFVVLLVVGLGLGIDYVVLRRTYRSDLPSSQPPVNPLVPPASRRASSPFLRLVPLTFQSASHPI